ncbi:MFS transporter [Roseovarius aestuarii]|uniref:Putative MFS-type transporter YhjX n=1 Tax=Roseovarius aestuarii TaxID=475083 RepID=A0A1X7BKR0_9RHOB|nr:MFS transporter [Roseovarius aestuarii]SMC10233.1 putative MFS-type transporter YhjX [Roseovarius aestuarii]
MTEDADILDSPYAWARLVVSLLIAVICSAGIWVMVLIMPAVQAEFGVSRGDVSLPYTLTMIGFAIGNFGIGRMVDAVGATKAIMGAGIILGAGFALAAISGSIWALSLVQMVIGFGAAAGFGPLMADISQWFLRRRGVAVAIAASGNYLSGAIWPLLLTGVLEDQGWRGVYWVLAAATVLGMIPLALILRRQVPLAARARSDTISHKRAQAAGIRPGALMILLGMAGIGCCVAMSMPQVHIVSFCVDLGYSAGIGGQMLSLMLLCGVVSRLASGFLADWLGGVKTVLIGSALQCLALFLYLPAGGLVSLYLVSAIFGLAQGGIVPSYAVVVREYMPSEEAGRRVGFVLMMTILGMAIGGWMSGWIYDVTGDYGMAFLNGIAWNFLNIAIMLMILTRTRTRSVAPA